MMIYKLREKLNTSIVKLIRVKSTNRKMYSFNVILVVFVYCNLTVLAMKVNRKIAMQGIGVVAESEKERHHVEDLIRKSIFNEIDTSNAEHVHISDQVEPLIRKMIRTEYAGEDNHGRVSRDSKEIDQRLQNDNGTKYNVTSKILTNKIVPSSIHLSTNNRAAKIQKLSTTDQTTIDDEDGDIDSGDGSSGDDDDTSGSGVAEAENKKIVTVPPKVTPSTRAISGKRITLTTLDWYSLFRRTTTSTTTKRPTTTTTTLTTKKSASNSQTKTQIFYYGPCMFCKPAMSYFDRFQDEIRRKQFRSILINYDFVFLAQKFPSGLFGNILTFEVGRTTFPVHRYLQIHAPLSCGCFTEAANTRYVLAGSHYAGRMILNSFYPLYKVDTFKDIEELQETLKFGKRVIMDTI